MNYKLFFLLFSLIQVGFFSKSFGQAGTNPIFRDAFTADPSPMVYNGRLYVYVGQDAAKDGELFNMTGWRCYSTTDMVNWTSHGVIMTPTNFTWGAADAWAAQCVERNGKFYLYVTVTGKNPYGGRNVGVAVSDSPTGPFVDARGTPLIRDNMTNNGKTWDDIDPTVLIDDDGQAYLSWGNPICYLVKLKANMTEIDGTIAQITPPNYAEGPWLSKRKGLYYLTYPAFVSPVGSEQLCYATATNINGPWTYRGVLSGTAKNSYTIHPGIVEYKGQSYLFYHNATLTLNGQGPATGRRSVCVEYLCYNEDGTIKPITQTTAGISVASPCPAVTGPTVSFSLPSHNTTFVVGENITLTTTATTPSSTVKDIKFYDGGTLLNTDAASPYSFVWADATAGTHTIKAVVTDNAGKIAESTITIKVNAPQGPYNGTWNLIPGTIQFENFDVGGNGFAYMDDSPGSAVTPVVNFRTNEDVDIETCTDAGGGYNLGYTTAGEWTEYSVDVQTAGTYEINLRVACSGDARTISLSLDGVNIAANIAIPNTTGWQTWQTVKVPNINLKAGKQILRMTIGATDYVNLNYATFVLTKELKQEPFKGTALAIPGMIQAEDYDLGGEGLAYHEANINGNQGLATLRNDEVDVETTTDAGGGYNVAYILNGEWLEYSVNVAESAKYDFEFRLAKDGAGGLFHVEIDGVNVTGAITVPNTAGWQVWQTAITKEINLSAGAHIMRVVFDSDYMNFNYVNVKKSVVTSLEDSNNLSFEMYPNPSQGIFTLSYDCYSNCDDKSILITDLSGKQIEAIYLSKNASQITIDLSGYSNGIYIIQFNGNNYRAVKTSF